jgi:HSP20 family protein
MRSVCSHHILVDCAHIVYFRRNFDQVFENFYNSTRRAGSGERSSEWAFTPAVETGWTDDYLNLRVVLRGVSQHDLNITVQGDQLIIQGERKLPEGFGKEGTSYTHLSYCKFERVPDLPGGLDMEKLQASLRDGVLDIRVPVAAAVKPKQIDISVGAPETPKTVAA